MASPYLDPKQLEAFIAVMAVGSVTGAARSLGRSQPVVTRQVQELEAELGFQLLHRSGPRITPTERATRFFPDAELMLAGLQSITARARDISAETPPTLRIAAIPSIAAGLVAPALAILPVSKTPDRIRVESTTAPLVVQGVQSRMMDLGISSAPIDKPGLDAHWSVEVELTAIVHPDDPLSRETRIFPQMLAERRLVMPADSYRQRMMLNDEFKRFGVEPSKILESNANYFTVSAVKAGLGVGLLDPVTIIGLGGLGLVAVPLGFRIPYRFAIFTATARPMHDGIVAMIEALDTVARSLPGARRFAQ